MHSTMPSSESTQLSDSDSADSVDAVRHGSRPAASPPCSARRNKLGHLCSVCTFFAAALCCGLLAFAIAFNTAGSPTHLLRYTACHTKVLDLAGLTANIFDANLKINELQFGLTKPSPDTTVDAVMDGVYHLPAVSASETETDGDGKDHFVLEKVGDYFITICPLLPEIFCCAKAQLSGRRTLCWRNWHRPEERHMTPRSRLSAICGLVFNSLSSIAAVKDDDSFAYERFKGKPDQENLPFPWKRRHKGAQAMAADFEGLQLSFADSILFGMHPTADSDGNCLPSFENYQAASAALKKAAHNQGNLDEPVNITLRSSSSDRWHMPVSSTVRHVLDRYERLISHAFELKEECYFLSYCHENEQESGGGWAFRHPMCPDTPPRRPNREEFCADYSHMRKWDCEVAYMNSFDANNSNYTSKMSLLQHRTQKWLEMLIDIFLQDADQDGPIMFDYYSLFWTLDRGGDALPLMLHDESHLFSRLRHLLAVELGARMMVRISTEAIEAKGLYSSFWGLEMGWALDYKNWSRGGACGYRPPVQEIRELASLLPALKKARQEVVAAAFQAVTACDQAGDTHKLVTDLTLGQGWAELQFERPGTSHSKPHLQITRYALPPPEEQITKLKELSARFVGFVERLQKVEEAAAERVDTRAQMMAEKNAREAEEDKERDRKWYEVLKEMNCHYRNQNATRLWRWLVCPPKEKDVAYTLLMRAQERQERQETEEETEAQPQQKREAGEEDEDKDGSDKGQWQLPNSFYQSLLRNMDHADRREARRAGRKPPAADTTTESDDPNYYSVLGVPRDASAAQIKAAFRREARRLHPDKAAAVGVAEKEATEAMTRANEAYGVLSDERLRERYDKGILAPDDRQEVFRRMAKQQAQRRARWASWASPSQGSA